MQAGIKYLRSRGGLILVGVWLVGLASKTSEANVTFFALDEEPTATASIGYWPAPAKSVSFIPYRTDGSETPVDRCGAATTQVNFHCLPWSSMKARPSSSLSMASCLKEVVGAREERRPAAGRTRVGGGVRGGGVGRRGGGGHPRFEGARNHSGRSSASCARTRVSAVFRSRAQLRPARARGAGRGCRGPT